MACHPEKGRIQSFRVNYLSEVKIGEVCFNFDELRTKLNRAQRYMWGVNIRETDQFLEQVEFTIKVEAGEEHILRRLQREKRTGRVEKADRTHYRFFAEVL